MSRAARPFVVPLLAVLLATSGACASKPAPAAPPPIRSDVIARGTSREDLLFRYGVPTSAMERGRILCWRLVGGVPVFPEHRPNHPEYASWRRPTTSLVVILGADGRAERSAEITVDVVGR